MQQVAGPYIQPSSASQTTSYTGTAGVTTNPVPPGTQAIWIWTDSAAYVTIGTSPTATTTDFPLPANTPILWPLNSAQAGLGMKVSAVRVSASGNLYTAPVQF